MSVDNNMTYKLQYSFNEAAVRQALTAKNVKASEIDTVINEIKSGDFSSLSKYGLESMVSFSSPSLVPPPNPNPKSLGAALERFNQFNMMTVLLVLHEAGKELREASREMRHAERDSAMAHSFANAEKIRSAALTSFIFSVVQGASSIGMGLYAAGSAMSQLGNMKAANAEYSSAKLEMNQVKADGKLADSQIKLGEAKTDVKNCQENIQKLETRAAAEKNLVQAEQKRDAVFADPKATSKEKAAALDDLKAKQAELNKVGGPIKPGEVEAAQTELKAAEQKYAALEVKVNDLAAKADTKAAEMEKDIDKNIAALKEKQGKLEGSDPEAKKLDAEIKALEQKKADLGEFRKMCGDPLSDNSIKGAEARSVEAQRQIRGPVGERLENAEQAKKDVDAKANLVNQRTQALNSAAQGLNQIIGGIGTMASEEQKAQGAEETAEAQKATSKENEEAEFQKSFNELIASVQQLLKEVLQGQIRANSAIYQNM